MILMGEPLHYPPGKLLCTSERIKGARLHFTDQHLLRINGMQPAFEASACRKRPKTKHLKGAWRRPMLDQQIPVIDTARAVVWQLSQRICKHRPSSCFAPIENRLLISGSVGRQSTPRPRHHNAWLVRLQGRNNFVARPGCWTTRDRTGHPAKRAAEIKQILNRCMQRFIERKIEMDGAWCTAMAGERGIPGPDGKVLNSLLLKMGETSPGA